MPLLLTIAFMNFVFIALDDQKKISSTFHLTNIFFSHAGTIFPHGLNTIGFERNQH
jgi:hypothetical protein